ncbi:MAG: GntR family transcriptional regulator [Coriobacteriales bacterium]|jgi:GntR family transcriptional regulator|nr:GntR family transcriptional regulator [Coriobacteriales bacterium]
MIFEIDTTSDVPLWVQLRQRLVHLINNGHYKPGDQLPTVRGLASELSINYNTVNKAYLSMIQDGYITSTRGRGVFVSAISEADEELVLEAEGLLDELIEAFRGLGFSSWEVRKLFAKRLHSLDAAYDADREAAARGGAARNATARNATARNATARNATTTEKPTIATRGSKKASLPDERMAQ